MSGGQAGPPDTASGGLVWYVVTEAESRSSTQAEHSSQAEHAARIAGLDTSVAHPARVYDYWLGGTDNFAADREAAERVLAVTPGLRFRVRANRAGPGRGRTPPARDVRVMPNQKGYVPGCNGQLVTDGQVIIGAMLSRHPVGRTLLHPLLDT